MRDRIWAVTGAAIVLLGLGGALAGCSSSGGAAPPLNTGPGMHVPSSSPASSSPSLPSMGGLPNIPVIELGKSFSPSTLQVGVGQEFEVIVSKSFYVSGLSVPGCAGGKSVLLGGGLLAVQCKSSTDYMYSLKHSGIATVVAMVQPHCAAGVACPAWVARPELKVTISS